MTDEVYLLARFADILAVRRYHYHIFKMVDEFGDGPAIQREKKRLDLVSNSPEFAWYQFAWVITSLIHHKIDSPQKLLDRLTYYIKRRNMRRLRYTALLLPFIAGLLYLGLKHSNSEVSNYLISAFQDYAFYILGGAILIIAFFLGRRFFSRAERLEWLEKKRCDPGILQLVALKYIKEGDKLLDSGKLQGALNAYNKAAVVNHGDYKLHNYLGLTYREAGEFDRAVEQYEKALTLEPGDAEVHFNLANIYARLDSRSFNPEKAETNYLETIRLRPKYAPAHYNLATHYVDMRRYNDARQYLENAQRLGIAEDKIEEVMWELERRERRSGRSS